MTQYDLEITLKELGRRIAELRESRSITQEKLAEMIGVQKRWISRVENGWSTTMKTLIKIANALNINLEEFFKKPTLQPRGRGRPKQKRGGDVACTSLRSFE